MAHFRLTLSSFPAEEPHRDPYRRSDRRRHPPGPHPLLARRRGRPPSAPRRRPGLGRGCRRRAEVDGQIVLQLGRMKCDRALPPLKPKARPKRRVNAPRFDVRAAGRASASARTWPWRKRWASWPGWREGSGSNGTPTRPSPLAHRDATTALRDQGRRISIRGPQSGTVAGLRIAKRVIGGGRVFRCVEEAGLELSAFDSVRQGRNGRSRSPAYEE
jgi:hypothetical protein